MNELIVNNIPIRLDEEFVSLTDIAREVGTRRPDAILQSWLQNGNTLLFLKEWEQRNNSRFKPMQMDGFIVEAIDNRGSVTVSRYVELTGGVGLYSKRGRGGGTFAHPDIALFFCYWLSPPFAVWMVESFRQMLGQEYNRKNLEFHIDRITDSIEAARDWLDTIPYQRPERNRYSQTENQQKLESGAAKQEDYDFEEFQNVEPDS